MHLIEVNSTPACAEDLLPCFTRELTRVAIDGYFAPPDDEDDGAWEEAFVGKGGVAPQFAGRFDLLWSAESQWAEGVEPSASRGGGGGNDEGGDGSS